MAKPGWVNLGSSVEAFGKIWAEKLGWTTTGEQQALTPRCYSALLWPKGKAPGITEETARTCIRKSSQEAKAADSTVKSK